MGKFNTAVFWSRVLIAFVGSIFMSTVLSADVEAREAYEPLAAQIDNPAELSGTVP
jgi:hypothetical protein